MKKNIISGSEYEFQALDFGPGDFLKIGLSPPLGEEIYVIPRIFSKSLFKIVRKGQRPLNFLTRDIALRFLNQMRCYKWYFGQTLREYQPKQKTNLNKIFFVGFQRNFVHSQTQKNQVFKIKERHDLIPKI